MYLEGKQVMRARQKYIHFRNDLQFSAVLLQILTIVTSVHLPGALFWEEHRIIVLPVACIYQVNMTFGTCENTAYGYLTAELTGMLSEDTFANSRLLDIH